MGFGLEVAEEAPHRGEEVGDGLVAEAFAQRAAVLRAAYAAHPERFVNQAPIPPPLPTAAWINPPKTTATSEVSQ